MASACINNLMLDRNIEKESILLDKFINFWA